MGINDKGANKLGGQAVPDGAQVYCLFEVKGRLHKSMKEQNKNIVNSLPGKKFPLALFSIICLLNKNTKQKNKTEIRHHPRGVVSMQREKTA